MNVRRRIASRNSSGPPSRFVEVFVVGCFPTKKAENPGFYYVFPRLQDISHADILVKLIEYACAMQRASPSASPEDVSESLQLFFFEAVPNDHGPLDTSWELFVERLGLRRRIGRSPRTCPCGRYACEEVDADVAWSDVSS